MSVTGDERALSLAGREAPDGLVVLLGDDCEAQQDAPVVRFGTRARDGERLVSVDDDPAPWRRAPWPVADGLFGLDGAPPQAVLAVGVDDEAAAKLAGARGLAVTRTEQLTVDGIAAHGALVLGGSPFPAEGFCALAAGRIVVFLGATVRFGLHDGLDCFFAGHVDQALAALEAAAADPEAFAPVAAAGRLAAEHHRASRSLARLATDIELESE